MHVAKVLAVYDAEERVGRKMLLFKLVVAD
jgi:hypothetical protein